MKMKYRVKILKQSYLKHANSDSHADYDRRVLFDVINHGVRAALKYCVIIMPINMPR